MCVDTCRVCFVFVILFIGFVFVMNYHSSSFCRTVVNVSMILCLVFTLYEWVITRQSSKEQFGYYHWVLMEDFHTELAMTYYTIWIITISVSFVMFIASMTVSMIEHKQFANSQQQTAQQHKNVAEMTAIEIHNDQSAGVDE